VGARPTTNAERRLNNTYIVLSLTRQSTPCGEDIGSIPMVQGKINTNVLADRIVTYSIVDGHIRV